MRDLAWYILTVTPLCEKAVARRLTRTVDPTWVVTRDAEGDETPWDGTTSGNGVATFAPIVHEKVRRRGSRYTLERLLLPRYLFVGLEAEPRWYDLRQVMGVQGVLGVDGSPLCISDELVGELMFRCHRGDFMPSEPPKIQRGMGVVMTSGVYRGFEGVVKGLRRNDPVAKVLVNLFGNNTIVRIPLDDLVSVSYAQVRMIG